jgi:hypothetical protein
MRGLLFIGMILTLSCSNRDNGQVNGKSDSPLESDLKFNTVDFDSLLLKQFVFNNDKLLDISQIELSDKSKTDKFNAIIKSDSNKLKLFKASKFKIKNDNKCNGYRHLYIIKEREVNSFDLEPYYALFLVIIDPSDKTILTKKLEEKSKSMAMVTSITDNSNWKLSPDSLLTIDSESHWCSDVEIEGQGSTCWTENISKIYKLRCDGLKLLKKDSVRTDRTE